MNHVDGHLMECIAVLNVVRCLFVYPCVCADAHSNYLHLNDRVQYIRDYHHALLSFVDPLYGTRSACEAATYMCSWYIMNETILLIILSNGCAFLDPLITSDMETFLYMYIDLNSQLAIHDILRLTLQALGV